MKLGRLVIVALAALVLSAPATASVSADEGVYANLSALARVVSKLG